MQATIGSVIALPLTHTENLCQIKYTSVYGHSHVISSLETSHVLNKHILT